MCSLVKLQEDLSSLALLQQLGGYPSLVLTYYSSCSNRFLQAKFAFGVLNKRKAAFENKGGLNSHSYFALSMRFNVLHSFLNRGYFFSVFIRNFRFELFF